MFSCAAVRERPSSTADLSGVPNLDNATDESVQHVSAKNADAAQAMVAALATQQQEWSGVMSPPVAGRAPQSLSGCHEFTALARVVDSLQRDIKTMQSQLIERLETRMKEYAGVLYEEHSAALKITVKQEVEDLLPGHSISLGSKGSSPVAPSTSPYLLKQRGHQEANTTRSPSPQPRSASLLQLPSKTETDDVELFPRVEILRVREEMVRFAEQLNQVKEQLAVKQLECAGEKASAEKSDSTLEDRVNLVEQVLASLLADDAAGGDGQRHWNASILEEFKLGQRQTLHHKFDVLEGQQENIQKATAECQEKLVAELQGERAASLQMALKIAELTVSLQEVRESVSAPSQERLESRLSIVETLEFARSPVSQEATETYEQSTDSLKAESAGLIRSITAQVKSALSDIQRERSEERDAEQSPRPALAALARQSCTPRLPPRGRPADQSPSRFSAPHSLLPAPRGGAARSSSPMPSNWLGSIVMDPFSSKPFESTVSQPVSIHSPSRPSSVHSRNGSLQTPLPIAASSQTQDVYIPCHVRGLPVVQHLHGNRFLYDASATGNIKPLAYRNSKNLEDVHSTMAIQQLESVDGTVEETEGGIKWLKVKVVAPSGRPSQLSPRHAPVQRYVSASHGIPHAQAQTQRQDSPLTFSQIRRKSQTSSVPASVLFGVGASVAPWISPPSMSQTPRQHSPANPISLSGSPSPHKAMASPSPSQRRPDRTPQPQRGWSLTAPVAARAAYGSLGSGPQEQVCQSAQPHAAASQRSTPRNEHQNAPSAHDILRANMSL